MKIYATDMTNLKIFLLILKFLVTIKKKNLKKIYHKVDLTTIEEFHSSKTYRIKMIMNVKNHINTIEKYQELKSWMNLLKILSLTQKKYKK